MPKTKISGLASHRRRCRNLAAAAPVVVEAAAIAAAGEIRESIRATIAGMELVDSWHMHNSVEIRVSPKGVDVGLWGDDFPGDFYPAFVHYGTAHAEASYFMTRAFQSVEDAATRRMEFVIAAGVGKV